MLEPFQHTFHMGKQYNKVIKRRRHKAYLTRRKARVAAERKEATKA